MKGTKSMKRMESMKCMESMENMESMESMESMEGAEMLEIRRMKAEDAEMMREIFLRYGIRRPEGYYERCGEENEAGTRITLLAFWQGEYAGSLHLLMKSSYPYFAENDIPEINDFNVIPPMRRKGIGNALLDAAEKTALEMRGIVGIGVGLMASYGQAQRLYARRGYIPDGRGVVYRGEPVPAGAQVVVDDDLNLFFTKTTG